MTTATMKRELKKTLNECREVSARPLGWAYLFGDVEVTEQGDVMISAPCVVTGRTFGVIVEGELIDRCMIEANPEATLEELGEVVRSFLVGGLSPAGRCILEDDDEMTFKHGG